MRNSAKSFLSPYTLIFLSTYYGVWLIWDFIKLPFSNPVNTISYLPSIHYNPQNNVMRFLLAIMLPPLACLLFWLITNSSKTSRIKKRSARTAISVVVIALCIILSQSLAIVSGSTNPANNTADIDGSHNGYAMVDTFHEGETLGPATLYKQESMKPYRDFVIVHGVVQDPLRSVVAFKLFGKSVGASRTLGVILYMLVFLLLYALLLVIFNGSVFKAALGLTILGLLLQPTLTIPWIGNYLVGINLPFRDIPTILVLIATIMGMRFALAKKYYLVSVCSLIVGFLATASFANSFDRALYGLCITGVWLLLVLVTIGWRQLVRWPGLSFLVGFIMGIPVLGAALKWDFIDFYRYISTVSKYKEYLDGTVFSRPGLNYNLIFIITGALVTLGGAWLIGNLKPHKIHAKSIRGYTTEVLASFKRFMPKAYMPILLGAPAIIFLRSAIGRTDLGHFAYSVQWLYILLIYLGINGLFWSRPAPTARRLFSYITVILLVFTSLYFAGRVRGINIRRDTFPLHISDEKFIRQDYLDTAAYLNKNLATNETFVTLTSEGIWNYLVEKPSPIKYPIIWYAFPENERINIAKQIEMNESIRYIITNTTWTNNFDYIANDIRFPEVYSVFRSKYQPVAGFGQQTVWERKLMQ